MRKKAVSPVIATVLLIAIVIVLALIVFLWARGFVKEAVEKTVGENKIPADQACGEISLGLSYAGSDLQITNSGNIPVYQLDIMKTSGGSVTKERYTSGLAKGRSVVASIGSGYEKVEVIPIILGETETGQKVYTCQNKFSTAP